VCVLVGERGRERKENKEKERYRVKKYRIAFVSVFVGGRGRETEG
jgi:hypothetical protein